MKIYKAETLIIYTKQEIEMEIGSRWLFLEEGKNGDIKLERFGIGVLIEEVFVDKSVFEENFKLDEVGCDVCSDRMIGEVYECEDKELCFDCLMEEAGVETETVTNYYLDGYYLGNNLDREPLSNELKAQLEVKVIKLGAE